MTGLWVIQANFTEYSKSDYTTIPLTGPSLHGTLTVQAPSHGAYGVRGAFTAQPCSVFGTDGRCEQLGNEVALTGTSGFVTLAADTGSDGNSIYVDLSGGAVALHHFRIQGNTMTGQAGWIPMFGAPRPPSYDGTFVGHRLY